MKQPSSKTLREDSVSLSFVAASLRPELVRVVAEAYLREGDWDSARTCVLEKNALQSRSRLSAIRMERELRQRLQRLTKEEIKLAADGDSEERAAIAWLAALKGSEYIFMFAAEVLRGKLAVLDPVLRASDYEAYFENQAAIHPKLHSLTPSSRTKVRTVLMSMLRESGINTGTKREIRIQRPIIPPAVQSAVLGDSSHWLKGFLVPDREIPD